MVYNSPMLLVKTKIGRSKIHGIGLFADQFIPKGTVTWKYDPEFDVGFSQKEIDSMPQLQKDYMLYYCYLDKKVKKYILCADNQKFINHSNKKEGINISSTPREDVAARDIEAGEELLCDYNLFDDSYFERMGISARDLL